jgi:hypothetical protein
MIAARMFTRFIWKPETTVKNTERPTRPPMLLDGVRAARREGVEVQRQLHVVHRLPQRLPHRMPHRLHVPRAGELEAADAHLGDAIDLLHRGVDVAVGQAGQPDVPVGIVAAEVLQPVVVDAQHLVRRILVVEPARRAQDAVDHLGIDAVAVEVLDAQVRVGDAADVLGAVLVEAGLGHHVDAMDACPSGTCCRPGRRRS